MKRLRNFSDIVVFASGVLLAILEKGEVIEGNPNLDTGTVSAGYQNFIICVEMFFASVALRYAFPYQIYGGDFNVSGPGRSVTMQSISSSLKVTKWFTVYRVCSWILVEYSVESVEYVPGSLCTGLVSNITLYSFIFQSVFHSFLWAGSH